MRDVINTSNRIIFQIYTVMLWIDAATLVLGGVQNQHIFRNGSFLHRCIKCPDICKVMPFSFEHGQNILAIAMCGYLSN
jgi:hypothetical protein